MRNDDDIQIYYIDKTKLDECTDYFDSEFGKVKVTSAKISNKWEKRKYEKFMYKYLRKQLFENLKFICAKNKKELADNFKDLKEKSQKINKPTQQTLTQATPEISNITEVGQIEFDSNQID